MLLGIYIACFAAMSAAGETKQDPAVAAAEAKYKEAQAQLETAKKELIAAKKAVLEAQAK